jgi:CSLREA domain-containing protein
MIGKRTRRPAREGSLALGLLLVAASLVVGLLAARPADALTFTVNETRDTADANLTDPICDASALSGRQCTLRAAIQEANDTPGADTIGFNIVSGGVVKTISPASPLPAITEAVTIDGYSQPGSSANTLAVGNDAVLLVQLNGTKAGLTADGLAIRTSNSTIRGLAIQRFGGDGIEVRGSGARANRVEGNFVGTSIGGNTALGNGANGVFVVSGAFSNVIGGTTSAARNVISGNRDSGVAISSSAARNKVLGNYIGTTRDGNTDLGNANYGVDIRFISSSNTIGSTTSAAARNVISGNDASGIKISSTGTSGNTVQGNLIGTNANGTADLGNADSGVLIFANASRNIVGGTVGAARNVISGNGSGGVVISGIGTAGNKVLGNFIGTTVTGTAALGNTDNGVFIFSGASNNTVGGTVSAAGNRIANNGGDGVLISSGTGNSVLSNSTFSNGGLGLDLGGDGVTQNDLDDPDTGANNLQNAPVKLSAVRSNATALTTITGRLNSNPDQDFIVQCFVAVPDPSGHGEGQIPAGQDTTVTTDANGNASFACVSPIPVAGQAVTATATNKSGTVSGASIGDTSEFSRIAGVVTGP